MFSKIVILSVVFFSVVIGSEDLKAGDKAPDFSLPDETGKIHTLSDYRGKILALYFYPRDHTPGCTEEACNLRDNISELEAAGVVILGVSYDDSQTHMEFIKNHDLPFHLLADTSKTVAKSYNAKSLFYGWMVPSRVTYLIDEDGIILHIIENVDTEAHAEQILEVINRIKKPE